MNDAPNEKEIDMRAHKEIEVLELPEVPNVEYFRDSNGEGWYCANTIVDNKRVGGVCYQEDDVIYDRGFGG